MKPLYLAPINYINDDSFRNLCLNYGADFVFTEMIWTDRIVEGDEFELSKLKISCPSKTVVQVVSKDHSSLLQGVKLILDKHPNIYEINYNMGCPQSALSKDFVAGGLLKDISKMKKAASAFYKACCELKFDNISVKLRIGFDKNNIIIEDYIKILSEIGFTKFYIHGRHLRQGYPTPATSAEVASIKDKFPFLEIIYNGDIDSFEKFESVKEVCNFDGFMIGRRALVDPTIFSRIKSGKQNVDTFEERLKVISELIDYSEDIVDLSRIKKQLSWMTKEIPKGAEFRAKLNDCKTFQDIKNLI